MYINTRYSVRITQKWNKWLLFFHMIFMATEQLQVLTEKDMPILNLQNACSLTSNYAPYRTWLNGFRLYLHGFTNIGISSKIHNLEPH